MDIFTQNIRRLERRRRKEKISAALWKAQNIERRKTPTKFYKLSVI